MTVHLQPTIFQMTSKIYSAEDVAEYFKTHDSLEIPPETEYLVRDNDYAFKWSPTYETNLQLMKRVLDKFIATVGKECLVRAQDGKLFLTTYDNGFGLKSLKGFIIKCRPIEM